MPDSETKLAAVDIPWASFCMSTYKRPDFLKRQLGKLLGQDYTNYEIIVSDNDPAQSAKLIVDYFNDTRIKYHPNQENIGMIKSYNRSIDRACGKFVVMITDDDPVEGDFLTMFFEVEKKHPGYSLYGGFGRIGKREMEVEVINKDNFLCEMLDPRKTNNILWSSCLVNRLDLMQIGKLPDYGSPHLFDHAMLAMAGSINGAVIMNKMYSTYIQHNANFSKSNFNLYYLSCTGFFDVMSTFCANKPNTHKNLKIVKKHLANWFIINYFSLKKYFSSNEQFNETKLNEIKELARRILGLKFMKPIRERFYFKTLIFHIKKKVGVI